MGIKINCTHNDQGAWCTNKKIKKSFFGIGARCCIEFPYSSTKCALKKSSPKPPPPPPPPPKRIYKDDQRVCPHCKKKI